MDALTPGLLRSVPFPGAPTGPSTATRLGRAWRDRLGRLLDLGPSGPGGSGFARDGLSAAARRNLLLAYTAAEIILGLGLLSWLTAAVDIGAGIASPQLASSALAGTTGGVLLWTVFGLMGSIRTASTGDEAVHFTFNLPYVGAAMVLGGPTAAAWVAFLSTIERRELESQPWYGVLSNHASAVIAAAVGAVSYVVMHAAVVAVTADDEVARFVAILVAGVVLEAMGNSLALVTIKIRDDMTWTGVAGLLLDDLRRETLLEIALIWVLVLAAGSGWWAPLLVGIVVIAFIRTTPTPELDDLTGVLRREAFNRKLEGKVGWMRRGILEGITLMSLDLNVFHEVNDRYGYDVGDEVLKAIAARLREHCPRREDVIARLMGDELAMLFVGLTSTEVAMRRANEIVEAICAPIATSAGTVHVGAAIGVHVVEAWGGVASGKALLRRAEQAMYVAKRDDSGCGAAHLFSDEDRGRFDDDQAAAARR